MVSASTAALRAIRHIAAEVPEATVGAGTVVTPEHVIAAVAAGARFLVSPGWTDLLLTALREPGVPCLPGVSTTSEVVALLERGVTEMKFFPAEVAGGAAYLKSLADRFPGPASARPGVSTPSVPRAISRCPTSAVRAALG
ncbi:hypothetical protein GCM10009753_64960 [Streptantibioticus ferralitis]